MLQNPSSWGVFLSLLLLPLTVLASAGTDYCQGDGSICEAYNDLDNTCEKQTGAKYYKCICESGWIPTDRACRWCLLSVGEFGLVRDAYYSSICSKDGYTVAPMPSSIVSAQKARNKTATVPEVTSTGSSEDSAATSFLTDIGTFEAYTTTIYGGGGEASSAALPTVAMVTEASTSEAQRMGSPRLMGAICVVIVTLLG